MTLIKGFRNIFKYMETSLWLATILFTIGIGNTFYFDKVKFNHIDLLPVDKLIQFFSIGLIVIAFILLLRKVIVYKLKSQSIENLHKNIDQHNGQFNLLKEQCSDYIDLIGETFIECDPDFTILKCSKNIKKLLGTESFELENKKLRQILQYSENFEEVELKYFRNGKKLLNYGIDCISSQGNVIPISSTFMNYHDKITDTNKILVVLKDRTSEIKIEELTHKSKLLFHNSKMASLGEMSGNIAHEINNPLTIIRGSVGRLSKLLIREGEYSEQVENLLERLNRMVERVSSIIYVMQSFSDTCEHSEKELVLIKDIVSTVVELNAEKLKFQGIKFDFLLSNVDAHVKINKSDIEQALMNIVNNASEAISKTGEKKGSISLKVISENGRLFITIENDKGAIDPELTDKIFEPFYTSKTRGIGMGLPIAHTLCQRNNVDLCLDSLDPVTFRLEFFGAIKV